MPLNPSLLPCAWQVLDLLQQTAVMILPPGEVSRHAMVSSIRTLQLRQMRSWRRLWTNQTRHVHLFLGISLLPPQEPLPLRAGTAPLLRVSRTSASSARPARRCELSPHSSCQNAALQWSLKVLHQAATTSTTLNGLLLPRRLTSAVAIHRRSVRPSRRTQGSRNPLRALAAREDIQQDPMGDRGSAASEEDPRLQAERSKRGGLFYTAAHTFYPTSTEFVHRQCLYLPKPSDVSESKNSSHVLTSADVLSPEFHPPFSSLMLLLVKGHSRVMLCGSSFGSAVFARLKTAACGDR